jgi:ABC-2 type transport system permease protein
MTTNAILAIAYRDFLKFARDPARLVSTFIFPLLFIGIFGPTMQANLGSTAGIDFLVFTLTGVFAQQLFMSAAQGVVSLLEDRENDFSQEIFISPVSRYAIVFGKIAGESLVALPQGLVILAFGPLIGVTLSWAQVAGLVAVGVAVCLFGGAFGIVLLSSFGSQRAANQIVPFLMIPQFFLAGVFTPIRVLPWYLDILSRLAPMRYAVDLTRGIFYAGRADAAQVVLAPPLVNLAVAGTSFALCLLVGTFLFVRAEQNR